jgi:type VI secretion system secreted protein Hcp
MVITIVFICGLVAGAAFYASLPTEQLQGQLGANAQSAGTIQAFLKIDDIVGQSQNEAHRNQIEILNFDWNESISTSGMNAGIIQAGTFKFTAESSIASPLLFMYCAQSRNIQKATLSVQVTDNNGISKEVLTWKLSNLIISAYTNAYDYKVLDYFELSFEKATMQYMPHDLDGIYGGMIEGTFDFSSIRHA